jgi:hypothetical protein
MSIWILHILHHCHILTFNNEESVHSFQKIKYFFYYSVQ